MIDQTTAVDQANWWKRLIAFFTTFRRKNPESDLQVSVESETRKKDVKEIKTLTDEFFQVINEIDSYDHKLLTKINTYIANFVSKYSSLGLWHGQRGTKDFTIDVSARSWAAQITEHVYSKIKGGSDGLAAQIAAKQQEKAKSEGEYDSSKLFHQGMLDYSRNDYKSFSIVSSIIYLVTGALLMLADLPISFSLVGNFDIGITDGDSTLDEKLVDYEKLLFAMGICFSSIYIKALYDEYINTPNGRWGKAVAEARQSERKIIIAELFVKLLIKLLILAGLLYTFYCLGYFRNAFNDNVNADVLDRAPEIYKIRLYSFIGLTVVIPAISGICLSKGFSILTNRLTLGKSKASMERSFARYQRVCNEYKDLLVLKSQLDACLEEWQDKKYKINNIAQQFVCAYEQGYKAAYKVMFGSDLFRTVEEYQVEVSTKKLQDLFIPKMAN